MQLGMLYRSRLMVKEKQQGTTVFFTVVVAVVTTAAVVAAAAAGVAVLAVADAVVDGGAVPITDPLEDAATGIAGVLTPVEFADLGLALVVPLTCVDPALAPPPPPPPPPW